MLSTLDRLNAVLTYIEFFKSSIVMKITRYNHTITTILKWTDKIDLITNKYKSKKE